MDLNKLRDRIRGSFVGGACGDALGYPVEFIFSSDDIKAKYGQDGICAYDTQYVWLDENQESGIALVSDDTQMSLYTAEALIESEQRGSDLPVAICNAYLAWFAGQSGKKVKLPYKSTLADIAELNRRRAPGNTCLSALQAIFNGKRPSNCSKGCGGVMRVAPIGLYAAAHNMSAEWCARTAGEAAEITHLHPLSTYSSAALAVIVQSCVQQENIDSLTFKNIVGESIEVVKATYGHTAPWISEFENIINKSIALADCELSDAETIETLIGEGWVAEETLAIALFSVIRHINDFGACIICAVNHGGDSDSTGAVAGNIAGAICGYNAIPEKFTTTLQFRDTILNIADAL